MRKMLSFILILVMCLSLCACSNNCNCACCDTCACGNNNTNNINNEVAHTFEDELTTGVWKKVLCKRETLSFNENGTGLMWARDFRWTIEDNTIYVITEHNTEYIFIVDTSKGYTRLLSEDGLCYVKEEYYISEREDQMEKLKEEAILVDIHSIAQQMERNPSATIAKYYGRPLKFTPPALSDIQEHYVVAYIGGNSERLNLDSDFTSHLGKSSYTFIGFLQNPRNGSLIYGAFVVE